MTKLEEGQAAEPDPRGFRPVAIFGPALAAFGIITTAAVVAAYRFGEGVIYINEQTISDLTFAEVTGGAVMGVLGVVFGLGLAAVGAVGAIIASVVGAIVGVLGLAIGSVVVIGFVSGPVLLAAVIGVLIKRRYWPDVI